MMDLLNLQPAIAEIFLALAALGLVLLSAFVMPQENASKLVRRLTLFSFLIAIFLIIYNGYKPAYAFNGQFFTSSFMVYMKVIILLGAIGILLMAKESSSKIKLIAQSCPC